MLKELQKAEVLFAIALFAFAVRFPLIEELSEHNLTFHMTVQHILLFLPGLILGAQLAKLAAPKKTVSILLAIAAVVLMGFWHLPKAWDLAYYHESMHILMHVSFFTAGVLVSLSLPSLGSLLKWSLVVLLLVFSSILAANTVGGRQIYQSSPAAQHTQLAIFMIFTMPVMFLAPALTPLYLPRLANFWIHNRLSLYGGSLLIVALLVGIFVM